MLFMLEIINMLLIELFIVNFDCFDMFNVLYKLDLEGNWIIVYWINKRELWFDVVKNKECCFNMIIL